MSDFYQALIATHPDYNKSQEYWRRLKLLAKGGQAVGIEQKSELLVNPAAREKDVVEARARVATYEPIMGTIVLKLVSQLLRDEAVYSGSNDPFWDKEFFPEGSLDPRVSAGRASFHSFLRKSVYQALVEGMAIAQIDTPPTPQAQTLAEQRQLGGDKPYVILRDREDLWDYCDDDKGFSFVKLHSYREEKPNWYSMPDRVHEFLVYERQDDGRVLASAYEVRLANDDHKKPFGDRDLMRYGEKDIVITEKFSNQEIFYVTNGGKPVYEFPVVAMCFEGAMWLADQLESLQVGQFNAGASGDWASYSTNYAMPVITMADGSVAQAFNDNPLRYFKAGNGYFIELKPGMKIDWFQREVSGINLAYEREEQYRQRMFSYIHQISSIVAAGYIKQSGESKKEDRRALDILLEVYGQVIKTYAAQVLRVAAIAHGEDVRWTVQGFSDYDSETLEESLAEYLAIDQAGINSKTLRREAQKMIAKRYGAEYGLDPSKMAQVDRELDTEPFHLAVPEIEAITDLMDSVAKGVPPEIVLDLLKSSNYLPDGLYEKALEIFEEMGLTTEAEEESDMTETEELEESDDAEESGEEDEGEGESEDDSADSTVDA